MKIYTKKGDKGLTSTFDGQELYKSNVMVNAYGEVDELNAHLALVASFAGDPTDKFLLSVQDYLFVIGSHLATHNQNFKSKLPPLDPAKTIEIEIEIDKMEEQLPKMTHFILPGKNFEVGLIHLARTVCRRAERSIVDAKSTYEVDDHIIQYINRLSDYLFVLSRHHAQKIGAQEIKWNVKN